VHLGGLAKAAVGCCSRYSAPDVKPRCFMARPEGQIRRGMAIMRDGRSIYKSLFSADVQQNGKTLDAEH
jgi:hypothetical protein